MYIMSSISVRHLGLHEFHLLFIFNASVSITRTESVLYYYPLIEGCRGSRLTAKLKFMKQLCNLMSVPYGQSRYTSQLETTYLGRILNNSGITLFSHACWSLKKLLRDVHI